MRALNCSTDAGRHRQQMGAPEYWTIDSDTSEELSGPVTDYQRAAECMANVSAYNGAVHVHLVVDTRGDNEPTGDPCQLPTSLIATVARRRVPRTVPGMPATLHLIRHAESAGNASYLIQGQTDFPLSDTGESQARRGRRTITESGLPILASSDLQRAGERRHHRGVARQILAKPRHPYIHPHDTARPGTSTTSTNQTAQNTRRITTPSPTAPCPPEQRLGRVRGAADARCWHVGCGSGSVGTMNIETSPTTPELWGDVVSAFGRRGDDPSWCWCQRFLEASDAADNRAALRLQVSTSPVPPGLVAYVDGLPAGWTRVMPRPDLPGILANRALSRVLTADDGAWWVTCFAVQQRFRGLGVARALLDAAVSHAGQHGATSVEGHPVDTEALKAERTSGSALFTGTMRLFVAAGFVEIGRTYPSRPVMRFDL